VSFKKFIVSKLDANHLLTTWKAAFNFETRISVFLSMISILVSSAKRMGVEILSMAKNK
jgi:hypothetical protein